MFSLSEATPGNNCTHPELRRHAIAGAASRPECRTASRPAGCGQGFPQHVRVTENSARSWARPVRVLGSDRPDGAKAVPLKFIDCPIRPETRFTCSQSGSGTRLGDDREWPYLKLLHRRPDHLASVIGPCRTMATSPFTGLALPDVLHLPPLPRAAVPVPVSSNVPCPMAPS
jgi:hypothetical protein